MKKLFVLAFVVMLGAGCSSLRFKSTEEVRAMGEEKYSNAEYNDALPYYDELIRRDEEDTSARLKRARSRDLSGNPLAAKEDYGAVIEHTPEDARARIYRAELAIRTGDLKTAESDLNSLSSNADLETYDQVMVFKFQGVLELKRNNISMATTYFRQAVTAGSGTSDPLTLKHVAESHYNLGQCYFLGNAFRESHENFVLYARLAPRVGLVVSAEDNYLLGVTAYLGGDFHAAQSFFAKTDPALRAKAAKALDDPGINSKQFH